MTPPTILGIDVGQSLGWCRLRAKQREFGTIKLPKKLTHQKRIELIRQLVRIHKPTVIGVEDVAFSKFPMAHASYWRIRTLFELVLETEKLPLMVPVSVKTLKLWATGNGNAGKTAMCQAARERYRVELFSSEEPNGSKPQEDMADACHVAAWVQESLRR